MTRLVRISFLLAFVGVGALFAVPPAAITRAAEADTTASAPTASPKATSPGGTAAPTRKSAPAPASAPQSALPLPPQQVIDYVSQTITWYRHIRALQQLPADPAAVVVRDRLSESALTALQLAFEFGHAAAVLDRPLPKPAAPGSSTAPAAPGSGGQSNGQSNGQSDGQSSSTGDLDRAAERISQRIGSLQSQLSALDVQIAHAQVTERRTLTARKAEVAAALDLEKEVQTTVAQIQRFAASSESRVGSASGLAAQIADLRRSVPEAHLKMANGSAADAATTAAGGPAAGSSVSADATGGANGDGGAAKAGHASHSAANSGAGSDTSSTFRPESAGVIALATQWFTVEGERGQLTDATKQTDALLKELDSVRSGVSQSARTLARQSLQTAPSGDPAQLAVARQQLEASAARFRQLSTLLVPVGEEAITVESAHGMLAQWQNSQNARRASVSRYLAIRIGVLLGSIIVVLAISEVWRRATFRYLHDSRRRAQFLALRRVAVGVALTLIIVFGLVSEVGSVATYAGLITAGLAVALQNVILAVVAYFFLIGRYGVRVGDRITLAGVTGRVVDIGLVRIYLMELSGQQLRSTGRMVVLSNAVLFQPTALFKQMPGGDYAWHTIAMTLAAGSDVQDAEKRLGEAANSVYEHYRPAIEQQHAALQRFIDFETAMPRPEVTIRLGEQGLECTVRYPVEPARSAAIDQKMLAAVRDAQAKAPQLQLVSGPVLKIDP
ncbi:MAG TPA: hypothetical protein VIY54_01960 [Steroidobacteraceae bacterium]